MNPNSKIALASSLAAMILLWTAGSPAAAQPNLEPATVTRAEAGDTGMWTLRSKHLVWGMPRQTDHRHNVEYPGESTPRSGLSVLVREGFVVGHYDLFKVPAWVAVRWTREDHDNLFDGRFGRDFGSDTELPRYAQAGTSYEFSTSDMERGHMARHEDNEAWGRDNSDAGCLMSNIVPQHKDMNGEAWNDLEEMHQQVVATPSLGIDAVWVISGPIFEDADGDGDEDPDRLVGNAVAVPQATYKVVGWFDRDGQFQARGYVVRQEDRVRNDPAHYLSSIDQIEAATGLDFFPELPAARADQLESIAHPDLWGSHGSADASGIGAGTVLISSLLPNPADDESVHETVTVRNEGTTTASLAGWRVRDAAGRTWSLIGELDPGDERTFRRDGQPMALNNNGDTVELLDATGRVVDVVVYEIAREGEEIDANRLR